MDSEQSLAELLGGLWLIGAWLRSDSSAEFEVWLSEVGREFVEWGTADAD